MAGKSDGARQYLKMCACGREFNGAPILEKVTNYYKEAKPLKKVLTSDIIKSEKERTVFRMTLKSYRIEMTNTKTGKKEIRHTLAESEKLAKCLIWVREDIISQWKINKIEED